MNENFPVENYFYNLINIQERIAVNMDWVYENKLVGEYMRMHGINADGFIVAGTDEAGRGPLAGPVYAAAVVLPTGIVIDGLDDSKKLSEKKREYLYEVITEKAVCYRVAYNDVGYIEQYNILEASLDAMRRAVAGIAVAGVEGFPC